MDRLRLYFRFLIEQGAIERWGPDWETADPRRRPRIEEECAVIQDPENDYSGAFIMLYEILAFCREQGIPYGPGRGSVGGCLVAYVLGIHDVDSLEWDLLFERFMNPDRVSFPDVDIDISQRHRQKVIDYVMRHFQHSGQVALRIGAFTRASGRSVVDSMLAAMADVDPNAGATATNLKKCFPDKGTITGGVKVQRELAYWLEKGHGDKKRFREIAEQAGWMDHMLKLDGMYTHLGKHAAGVVILREADLPYVPQTSTLNSDTGQREMATAYDMYSLDDLGYPKWDLLGLRTLDIVTDADKLTGGDGSMRRLLNIWQEHRDDPDIYEVLQEADTAGIFQMDTPGFQRTLRDMQPTEFKHIVELCALYRPGALDYTRLSDGKNMVEVFIERHHKREIPTYLDDRLKPILAETHGIILYQEQAMKIVRELAGFSRGQADSLRKAIGKKRPKDLAALKPLWDAGAAEIEEAPREAIWKNMEAAGRYSWNKSHAVEYAIITWWTAWARVRITAGYFAALINSLTGDREQQATIASKARQHVAFRPPDINTAEAGFLVQDDEIVFGLAGIKGLGETNRNAILVDRAINGPFKDFHDFCQRLPSVPSNMKRSLIACGAFNALGEDRALLLAAIPKGNPAWWVQFNCKHVMRKQKAAEIGSEERCSQCKTNRIVVDVSPVERKYWEVHEAINAGKELPSDPWDYEYPSDTDIAAGEMESMGYYVTSTPMGKVSEDLARMPQTYIGGEVHSIKVKPDRNGKDTAHIQLTTPDLARRRVIIFASNWVACSRHVEKGKQLIMRGRTDGDAYLAEHAWEPGDYRHFHKLKVWNGDQPTVQAFDPSAGREARAIMVREHEAAGHRVRLL